MTPARKEPAVLESGDRLTREEFHRRYCARLDIKKAELVQGAGYVPSAARSPQQAEPLGVLAMRLRGYRAKTTPRRFAANGAV